MRIKKTNKKNQQQQQQQHKTGTHEINKIPLSYYDDKRLVLDGDIHTLDYFDKDLRKQIVTDR